MPTLTRLWYETRAELRGNTLSGHAAVFDRSVELWPGYHERIAPGAFAAALKGSDVRALINHDASLLIGRESAGTLQLREDATGLAFSVDLPDTAAARDLKALIERGDISGASFGFMPGKFQRSRTEDGGQLITHTEIAQLRDVSPVTFPAYDATDVSLRSEREPLPGSPREQSIRLRAAFLRGTHGHN